MPPDATRIVEAWVQNVFANRSGALISVGLIFSLWAASSGVEALTAALSSAYEVEEGRPFWKARLVALGLVIALCLLLIGGAVLITFGDPLARALANLVGYQKTICFPPMEDHSKPMGRFADCLAGPNTTHVG